MRESVISRKFITKEFILNNIIYIFAFIFIVFMSLTNEKFLGVRNIINIFSQSSILIIVSIGMALTMITKGIDMSIGAVLFLSAAVMQYCGVELKWSLPMMCVAGILTGTFVGLINGVIAAKLDVYPLLTTLAVMYACRGLGMVITGGGAALMPIAWGDLASEKVLGIPLQVYLAIFLTVLVHIFLINTPFGRHIFALGDSQKTAREKGINIIAIKVIVYATSGCLCGIASIISSSQIMSAPSNMGTGLEFYAIIAAVLGGTSLFGGKGKIFPGCIIGAVIMSVISNSLVISGASANMYSVVYACVIFIVVLMDTIKTRKTNY